MKPASILNCARLATGVLSGMAAGVLTGACVLPPRGSGNVALIASATPFDRNVPVPVGFRLTELKGEGRFKSGDGILRQTYRGRADKKAVRDFYRREMPLVRWTFVNDAERPGHTSMWFERGGESCTIQIEDKSSGWSRGAVVHVLIAPVGIE